MEWPSFRISVQEASLEGACHGMERSQRRAERRGQIPDNIIRGPGSSYACIPWSEPRQCPAFIFSSFLPFSRWLLLETKITLISQPQPSFSLVTGSELTSSQWPFQTQAPSLWLAYFFHRSLGIYDLCLDGIILCLFVYFHLFFFSSNSSFFFFKSP